MYNYCCITERKTEYSRGLFLKYTKKIPIYISGVLLRVVSLLGNRTEHEGFNLVKGCVRSVLRVGPVLVDKQGRPETFPLDVPI